MSNPVSRNKDREAPLDDTTPVVAFDPEMRQFMSRLMAGYEGAHRRLADHADGLAAQLAEANRIAQKSLEMQVALVAEHEELVSRRHHRELEAMLAKQKSEAFGDVTRDARSILTLLVKKVAGIPLTGNDSHGVTDLLNTLDQKQIEGVMTDGKLELTMGQRQLLMGVFTSLAEAEAKKLAPKPEPEAEAAE